MTGSLTTTSRAKRGEGSSPAVQTRLSRDKYLWIYYMQNKLGKSQSEVLRMVIDIGMKELGYPLYK